MGRRYLGRLADWSADRSNITQQSWYRLRWIVMIATMLAISKLNDALYSGHTNGATRRLTAMTSSSSGQPILR